MSRGMGAMRVLWLWGALVAATGAAEPPVAEDGLLARVAGEPVTLSMLRDYARLNPVFVTEMVVPGGPMRVLENLINERLLVLEGERRQIPRPLGPRHDVPYAYEVRRHLVKDCPEPDEAAIKGFYETYLGRFSTPLFLRVRRLLLPVGTDPEQTLREAADLKGRIETGQADLAALADASPLDPIGRGRGGDLGYLAVGPGERVLNTLATLPVGAYSAPILQEQVVGIYQVTGRREPIPEPYESARERVRSEFLAQCTQDAFAVVRKALIAHWPVEVYVQDIGTQPELETATAKRP